MDTWSGGVWGALWALGRSAGIARSALNIGPLGPLPNVLGRTNHINLTRRIDPRNPEPPNSPISPKRAFSFFRFLGFGGERANFLGFRGGRGDPVWRLASSSGNAPARFGGMHRGAVHYPLFKDNE